jgi:hypothetical protein
MTFDLRRNSVFLIHRKKIIAEALTLTKKLRQAIKQQVTELHPLVQHDDSLPHG